MTIGQPDQPSYIHNGHTELENHRAKRINQLEDLVGSTEADTETQEGGNEDSRGGCSQQAGNALRPARVV